MGSCHDPWGWDRAQGRASPATHPRPSPGLMAQESLWSHDGVTFRKSAFRDLLEISPLGPQGKLFAGRCLTGGTPLQNYLREAPGEAAGHQLLLTPVPWRQHLAPKKLLVPQEPVSREAVSPQGLGAGEYAHTRELGAGEAACLAVGPASRESACTARARRWGSWELCRSLLSGLPEPRKEESSSLQPFSRALYWRSSVPC